jgi:hypothetical protein
MKEMLPGLVPWTEVAPIWLPEMMSGVLFPRIPATNQLAPVAAWITTLDEPSRLPITLFDMLKRPALLKVSMATNPAAPLKPPAKLVVWSIPEIVLPWIRVGVELLTDATWIPRNMLSNPLIIVVPVPPALANPITFPVIVWSVLDPLLIQIPEYSRPEKVNVRGAVW